MKILLMINKPVLVLNNELASLFGVFTVYVEFVKLAYNG